MVFSVEIMNTISYLNTEGVLSSACKHEISPETLLLGYRKMAFTRHIDERMITLQRQGVISFAMSSLGEEACAIASAAALKLQDWMYPQYREAGIFFWRGGTAKQFIHQMFCDALDPFHGRQMPNHFGARELNIVQVSSPIGTKIPHAAGCGYAMKLLKEEAVAICYIGEGATSEGDFHVGVNFAAVRKAPVIFFCRNNGYAISTPCREQFASDGIAPKGIGYGIETYKVDGNDFFALHEVVSQARAGCLQGKGPYLIEAMTYRMGAHSTSDDPSLYRSDEEVKGWQVKDPLLRLKLYLEKQGLWDSDKEKQMWKEISLEVDEAIAEAKATPPPSFHSMIDEVYFAVPASLERDYKIANADRSKGKVED
ncbi:MAG: thiamine pyrophosphate-dependent dehydrogenase E1 component subunit alpha [Parachlamydiaceae bacterium]|nr:thiamine pyrophosphate-dependent dehydrogenase E1 component subunit alpha [Parachlamydiaceae bacterium]